MTPEQAVRVVGWCSQVEIALVMRSPLVSPLLAQAARAADGLSGGDALALAARVARQVDLGAAEPGPAACRKVVQALCRVALQEAQAGLLGGP